VGDERGRDVPGAIGEEVERHRRPARGPACPPLRWRRGRVSRTGAAHEQATRTNTIGAPELIAVWKDPLFDPAQRAFYYARVMEIPTPRWTAYAARRFGVKPQPGARMTVTERAYTAPI